MSFEMARKIVDLIFDSTPINQSLDLSFFGGEPLLCSDLMKEVVEYIHFRNRTLNRCISFSVTSNGTLLNNNILDFLHDEGISLCISLDGPKHIHDRNRMHPNGTGSFDLIIENVIKAKKKISNLQINAVYTQDSIVHLPETVAFFKSIGINAIHLNPDIYGNWDPDNLPNLQPIFNGVANEYIDSYNTGKEIAINLLDSKIILFLKGGYQTIDKCSMGLTELAFAPSGNIYPCERFIGDDRDKRFCIGKTEDGINPKRRCELVKQRGGKNKECQTCNLQKYCMNWCGCTNYQMTSFTDRVAPTICLIEKATIYAAKQAFTSLQNNDIFLDHFMQYAQIENHIYQ